MSGSGGQGGTHARRQRERRGRRSEWIAAALLMAKGYRIIERRLKTRTGEVDLVALRRRRLAFVEVKARATFALCEASITPEQRRRVRQAADRWLARRPDLQEHDIAFDLVFVVPRSWPRHIENGL
jgi:putative endonuclease